MSTALWYMPEIFRIMLYAED